MIKKDRPLVSVIVTVYNTESWLEECLDSITCQTLHEIEIICVDDGSTDRSSEILEVKAGTDNRIRIISQKNRGVSDARNTGVRVASGRYLFFADSDDILDPDLLEICTENLIRRDLELLCFNVSAFGDDPDTARCAGEINRKQYKRILNDERIYTGQELFAELKQHRAYIASVQSCMLRRDAFLKHDLWFRPGIIHEDEMWMLSALMPLSRCGCINRILYRYRIRNNSLTFSPVSFSHVNSLFAGIQEVKQLLQEPQNEQIREQLVEHVLYLQEKASEEYRLCSQEEQQKRKELNPGERFLFEQIVVYPASMIDQAKRCDIENNELRDKYDAAKGKIQVFKQDKVLLKQTINQKNKQIKKHADELGRRKEETAALRKEKNKLQKKIRRVEQSETWRVGSMLIWLPGKAKRLLKKLLRKERNPGKKTDAVNVKTAAVCMPNPRENAMTVYPSEVSGNHIVFQYSVSGKWSSCFRTDESFEITYPFDIELVPESIRIIPFLSQVIPVSWVCDAEIRVPVCDRDFHDCLEEVKAGYRKMYPMMSFGGKLTVDSLEDNRKQEREEKALACWSGGVDSFATVISHLAEQPLLVSLWGSDIPWDDAEEWGILEKQLRDGAETLGLEQVTVRTSFRRLLYEGVLGKLVRESGDGWWHGFQHGIGILGHMAPVAWHEGIGNIYIASSFAPEYLHRYTCAADPWIDNYVRFCGAKAVHDGSELDRQGKIERIAEYSRKNSQPVSLHVCWEKKSGDNCCHCEKCWRTMLALYAEGAEPIQFGFPLFEGFDHLAEDLERDHFRFGHETEPNYRPIQKKLRERSTTEVIPQELSWLIETDLSQIEDGSLRLHKGKLVKPVWLLGTPDHNNLGDLCIAEEEHAFLQNVFPGRIIMEVNVSELSEEKYKQLKEIGSTQTVFLHGGGNIGTIWPRQESVRRKVINTLKNNRIVIFPQSIWFSEDDGGRRALAEATEIYKGENVLLCCREHASYRFAQEHFDCRSILLPDMALWELWQKPCSQERFGALTLLRNDKERKLSDADRAAIEAYLTKRFRSIEVFDTVLHSVKVTRENRREKLDELIRRISSAECVVTDRLHGMILCAVTGTPCVAFGNSYHKVEASYDWLTSLGYIRFVHRTEELADAIEEVCNCTERIYPENEMREQFGELIRSIAGP